jgi:hypothetical protein
MLKKYASGVLASLRGSEALEVFSVRQDPFYGRTATQSVGGTSLASSLVAALPAEWRVSARRDWAGEKSGLFEHPEANLTVAYMEDSIGVLCVN